MIRTILIASFAALLAGCQSLIGSDVAVIRVMDYSGGMAGMFGGGGVAVHQSNADQAYADVTIIYKTQSAEVVVESRDARHRESAP